MKKTVLIFTFLFLIVSVCSAETVYLKSGSSVKGKIVERTAGQVTIDANGMTLTYDEAEIDHDHVATEVLVFHQERVTAEGERAGWRLQFLE